MPPEYLALITLVIGLVFQPAKDGATALVRDRWANSGPDGRQAMVGSIFARTDVLGFERLEYDLTPDAIDLGLDVALPRVFQLGSQVGEFGRGERI